MKGIVTKIIPFSNVDGPGNRLSIFFQGCNFDCLYCHNPETIQILTEKKVKENKEIYKINGLEELKVMTIEDIIKEIDKVAIFISGITVSGGECTLQWQFLTQLFKSVKEKYPKLTCFVDSNCSVPLWTDEKKEFVNVIDKVMIDIKGFGEKEHKLLVGASNENVIKNFEFLAKINKIYEVRTVIVPEIVDNEKMVNNISKLIEKNDKNIKYKLIKYRQNGVREEVLKAYSPSDVYMKKLKKICEKNGLVDVVVI